MRLKNLWSRRPSNFPSSPLALILAVLALTLLAYLISARPLSWLFSYAADHPVRTLITAAVLVGAAHVYRNVIADSEGTDRAFWGMLGFGIFVRIVADLFWASGASHGFFPTAAIYGIAALLIASAFVLLVYRISRRMLVLGSLDALNVLISMSLFVCIAVRSPAELIAAFPDDAAAAPLFVRVPIDSAILYLSLLAISFENRRKFTRPLMLVFLLFFFGSWAALLNAVMGGEVSAVTHMLYAIPWALGLLFFVASSRLHEEIYQPEWHSGIAARRHALYWFGFLAPTTHGALVAAAFLLTGYVATHDGIVSNYLLVSVPESISPQQYTYAWAFLIPLFLAFAARFTTYGYITESLSQWRTRRMQDHTRFDIAAELHKDVKQTLNAARNQADLAEQYRHIGDIETFQACFDKATELQNRAYTELAEHLDRIRPSREPVEGRRLGEVPHAERANVDDLEQAITHEADRKREDFLLAPRLKNLHLAGSATWLDVEQKRAAVYIVNEALWNIIKNTENAPTTVEASNGLSDGGRPHLVLKIRDKGPGFEPDRVSHAGGITDMRYEAQAVGAEFSLDSQPGRGTTVAVTFYERRD